MPTNEENDASSLVRSVLEQLKKRFEILSTARGRSPSEIAREATILSDQAARVIHPLVESEQALVELLPKDFTSEPVYTVDGVEMKRSDGSTELLLETVEFYDKWWVAVVAELANTGANTRVSPHRSIKQTLDSILWKYRGQPLTHWALPSWRENTTFWPLFCEASCSAIDWCLGTLRPDFVLDSGTRKAMTVMQASLSGPVADSTPSAPPDNLCVFRMEGEYWTLVYGGKEVHMKDRKGFHDLAYLLQRPDEDVDVLTLANLELSDNGLQFALKCPSVTEDPVSDQDAIRNYGGRIQELDEELDEANANHDEAGQIRLQKDKDLMAKQLKSALGPGAQSRKFLTPVENARTAVTKRINTAIKAVEKEHAELGKHLTSSIDTGTSCRYRPEQELPWELS